MVDVFLFVEFCNHLKDCCGDTGLFLMTKGKTATQVVLCDSKGNMSAMSSPYVDRFGCADHGNFL